MNHNIIKQIIFDQHEVIRSSVIYPREYRFEEQANYILVGIRRAGKSSILYGMVQKLLERGCEAAQIIYVNFEDERLSEFMLADFNDIVETAAELSDKKHYFFFDEVQNIAGWERFARRLADAGERIYITGSNAAMLSGEMEAKLGGRFLSAEIMPYSFREYLTAAGIRHDETALYTAKMNGKIRAAASRILQAGTLPETLHFQEPRVYVENVYQKILLGDIAARYAIRNAQALRILIKKIAETVTSEVSYSKLHNTVNAVGLKISKDSVISYVSYAENAYLIFHMSNFISRFAERESTPRYYFYDNGVLNLFLINKAPLLLENIVAIHLKRRYGRVFFFKSSQTRIDVDFYVPEEGLAVQVCYALNAGDMDRELGSLQALARDAATFTREYIIVTLEDDERTIETEDADIRVLPLYRFLLG